MWGISATASSATLYNRPSPGRGVGIAPQAALQGGDTTRVKLNAPESGLTGAEEGEC